MRSLRAIRFATKLNFKIDSKVKEAIYEKGDLLGNISNARLFDEFCKIFLNGHGYENYKKLQSFGIAKYLLNLEKSILETKSMMNRSKTLIKGIEMVNLLLQVPSCSNLMAKVN